MSSACIRKKARRSTFLSPRTSSRFEIGPPLITGAASPLRLDPGAAHICAARVDDQRFTGQLRFGRREIRGERGHRLPLGGETVANGGDQSIADVAELRRAELKRGYIDHEILLAE